MAQLDKLFRRLMSGDSDSDFAFDDMVLLLRHLGVAEIINLQPRSDRGAKTYQVRQVRAIIVRYRLWSEPDAEV